MCKAKRCSNEQGSKCDIFSSSTLLEEIHDHYDDKGYKPIMPSGFRSLHGDVWTPLVKPCTSHTHSELQHVVPGTHWDLAPATEQKLLLHESGSTCLCHWQSYLFFNATSSMYDPFQWSQCPGVSVISFCWMALPVRWSWCKYVQRQWGVLTNPAVAVWGWRYSSPCPAATLDTALVTQHLQTRVICKASHPPRCPYVRMVHQLYFASSGSPVFPILSNSCFCLLNSSSPVFSHLPFWYSQIQTVTVWTRLGDNRLFFCLP